MTNVQVDLVFYDAAANIEVKDVTITFPANPQISTKKAILKDPNPQLYNCARKNR